MVDCPLRYFAYFVVMVVFFFALLSLYDYQQLKIYQQRKETFFAADAMVKTMLQPGQVIHFQGHQLPTEMPMSPPMYDHKPGEKPPVKCDKNDNNIPEALNMFEFNTCNPECCLESAYSCNGGCVCVENSQYELISKRGSCSEISRDEF